MKIKLTGDLEDTAIQIEIECPDDREPHDLEFGETWHCTVERKADDRRYQSFAGGSFVFQ